MEGVPPRTAVNNGQIESFVESIYREALDLLEINYIRRMDSSSMRSVALTSNQSANLFLKEVTRRAICVFSDKLSRFISSQHFQFGLLKDVDVKKIPPIVCLHMHGGRQPKQKQTLENETQRDIRSGQPKSLTSGNNCEGSKMQETPQDVTDAACPGEEAVQSLENSINSPPDQETGKDTESMTMMSTSHPNSVTCVDIEELGLSDLKEPNSQEAKNRNISKCTGFHPAKDFLQSEVNEKQVDPNPTKQSNSHGNEPNKKAPVNVSAETTFDTHCSLTLEDEHETLTEYPPGKFSQPALFNGSVGEGDEIPEKEAEIHEGCCSITRQMKVNQDQQVPDSHQKGMLDEEEESSLYYTMQETKDEGEASLDDEQISSCAVALGCHWFTSSTEGTTDMTSSRETSQKLSSIPACNRRRRVGLSRKQKVPTLHTKRLKLSEQ